MRAHSTDDQPSPWREVVALCCQPRHLRTTVPLALVVGTVLFVINQLDVVVRGHADAGTVAKIALTYLVPFSVSNYGIVHATIGRGRATASDGRPTPDDEGSSPSR